MVNMSIDGQNPGRMMSKTQHYRKVTKPLLERKRRARMNHYLDELKDLIIETMESQGEHITKLEKADILEMTVTYLREKNQRKSLSSSTVVANEVLQSTATPPPPVNAEKFRAGYTQAAYEVSKVFASIPGIDVHFGTKLMKHLGYKLKDLKPPSQFEQSVSIDRPSCSSHVASGSSSSSSNYHCVTPPHSPQLNEQKIYKNNEYPRKINDNLRDFEKEVINGDLWRPW